MPDDFLVDVITHGGSVEGLSSGMPALGAYLSDAQVGQLILYVRSLASPPFQTAAVVPPVPAARAPKQPIFFSPVVHGGQFRPVRQHCPARAQRPGLAA